MTGSEAPLFTTRSRYVFQVVMARSPWSYIYLMFFLLYIPELLNPRGLNLIYVFLFVCLTLWMLAFNIAQYISFRNRVYKFYPDRLEFVEGVFIRDQIKIPWHAVLEVRVKKSLPHFRTPVANIILPANYQGSTRGIVLLDIENAEALKEKIQAFIDEDTAQRDAENATPDPDPAEENTPPALSPEEQDH